MVLPRPGAPRVRAIWALSRWRARAAARELVRDAIGTLQGRLLLLLSVLALPGLVRIAVSGGPLAEAGLDAPSRLGALVMGEAALGVCYAVMIPVLLARGLVPARDREVLRPHSSFLPEVAVLHAGSAILGTALFLWTFFLLFQGRLLLSQVGGRWPPLAAHVVAGQVQFAVTGVLLAEGTRRLLRRPGRAQRAERIRRCGALPFLVSFPAFLWLPLLLEREAPGWLARFGATSGGPLFALQASFGVSSAISEDSAWHFAMWIAALFIGASIAVLVLRTWLSMGADELALVGEEHAGARPYRAFPLPRGGGAGARQLRLFWWKDVALPVVRRPGAYVSFHGGILTAVVLLATAGREAPGPIIRGPDFDVVVRLGGTELILGVAALLAMAKTLGSLGSEGRSLVLLRPVLGPWRLLWLKWCAAAAYVAGHIPLYALTIAAFGAWSALPGAGITSLFAIGLIAAPVFSFFGNALGFLMPDFRLRSAVLPGASRTSQLVFGFGVTSTAALLVLGRALHARGAIGDTEMLRFGASTMLGLAAISLCLSAWAVRRFDRLELER